MKTTLKTLIAVAVTAVAASVSTGASAASLAQRHDQNRAQVLNVQFNGSHVRGVQRASSVRGHHGFHGRRHFHRHHRHHRGVGGRGFGR